MKTKSKPPTWWNTELNNLRREVRKAHSKWRRGSLNPSMTPNEVSELKDAYHDTRKEYSKCIKKSKRDSWRKFTTECEDIYMLNKIIFKKQQNAIAMMEGCNTGL